MANQINEVSEYLFINTLLQDVSAGWVLALTNPSISFSFAARQNHSMQYILQLSSEWMHYNRSIHCFVLYFSACTTITFFL